MSSKQKVETPRASKVSFRHFRKSAVAVVDDGTSSVGIKASNGVVIATAFELVSEPCEEDCLPRIEIISEYVGMVYAGIEAEYRSLVKKAHQMELAHYMTYDQPLPVSQLAHNVAEHIQEYTLRSDAPIIGVHLLICGWYDGRPNLYECDPSGTCSACQNAAVGKHAANNKAFLEQHHSEDLELKDAVYQAILTLKSNYEGEIAPEKIEVGFCNNEGFQRLAISEIAEYLKKIP